MQKSVKYILLGVLSLSIGLYLSNPLDLAAVPFVVSTGLFSALLYFFVKKQFPGLYRCERRWIKKVLRIKR